MAHVKTLEDSTHAQNYKDWVHKRLVTHTLATIAILSFKVGDNRARVNLARGFKLIQPQEWNHYHFELLYVIPHM